MASHFSYTIDLDDKRHKHKTVGNLLSSHHLRCSHRDLQGVVIELEVSFEEKYTAIMEWFKLPSVL